ncbi:MAG: glutamate--tRNA ligase [Phycisphaerales bacterium]|nr:glutamate--tRNA ligase [Phycisphaerales bacterium]
MSSDSKTIVRTRFAPSPSGHLHVGGARTALFCWAYARQHGGKFILRIEDTDQKRSSDAASVGFLRDLKWLGIEWDEGPEFTDRDGSRCGGGAYGPYFQSQRLDLYTKYLQQLVLAEKAYYAFDTAAELDAQRKAARAANQNYRYDRTAATALSPDEVRRRREAGEPAVIRFRLPDEPIVIRDEILGEATIPAEQLDDFVICKADGFPTYHFAVVVDDELMQVTHVIRAQEHFMNTARHLRLQEALGFRRPVYAHLPLIFNPDGSKMSKRDKDKALRTAVKQRQLAAPPAAVGVGAFASWLKDKDRQLEFEEANALSEALGVPLPEINVDDFRRSGYLPEVLINYLALLGWNPGGDVEKFDKAFLVERFSFDRVMKGPAKFDRAKLLAFNHDAIQALSTEEFVRLFRAHCAEFHPEFIERLTPEHFDLLAAANHKRSKTLDDQVRSSRFFIDGDESITYDAADKNLRKVMCAGEPTGRAHLEALLPILQGVSDWSVATLEQAISAYVQLHAGGNLGKVAQPLRIAISGTTISPAIYETLTILGCDATLRRMRRCIEAFACV